MANSANFVADMVRARDYDRYLATLYAPEAKRDALLALYAFDAEIAGIRDRIREPMPGEIRLQWWRDVIASRSAGSGSGHPLADALVEAINAYDLPVRAFDNYLEARIFDLYDDPMPSRTDLEGYCGETAGALIQLSAMILDAKAAPDFTEAAGHAGCAQAICGMLRLLPVHRARGQCYLPRDMLAAAGTTSEEFVAGKSPEASGRATTILVALANEHLAAFQKEAGRLPPSLRPAFLPLALVPAYLARPSLHPQVPPTARYEPPAWRRQWLLFRAASKGWPRQRP
jgi:phytoene synthase